MHEYLKNSSWFLLYVGLTLAGSQGDSQAQTTNGSACPSGQIAFSGAEGYGRCTVGGNNGRVIEVTNLNDSGAGSLRQCAQVETGPRQCVFKVAGTIQLTSYNDVQIVNPNVTIDGSTAPGGGVALKYGGLDIRADQVIVRHLRVRPGPERYFTQGGLPVNGVTIRSTPAGRGISNVILDHLSMSWTTDDIVNIMFGSDHVTIQDSIFSEGLEYCGNGCIGKGLLISYGAQHVSILRNLSAHNPHRWPEYGGGGSARGYLQFTNNVLYNGHGTDTLVAPTSGPVSVNFVGNVWKYGANAHHLWSQYAAIRTVNFTYSPQSLIYVHDNLGHYWKPNVSPIQVTYGVANPDDRIINSDGAGVPQSPTVLNDEKGPMPSVTPLSASQTMDYVLSNVGALPRDTADARVIADVRNGTGRWLAKPEDVGGWPVLSGSGPSDQTPPIPPTNLLISGFPWLAVSAVAVPSTLFPIARMFRRRLSRSHNATR